MRTVRGVALIDGGERPGGEPAFTPIDPTTGERIEPAFGTSSRVDVDDACRAAAHAFDAYRLLPLERRALLLDGLANRVEAARDALVERAHLETGVPQARLVGEVARTAGQLRLMARAVRRGDVEATRVDRADGAAQPPTPDVRMRRIPVGPVAVFGASNFPLAFSVLGGDTASALAAGCSVVVKAHELHPGLSELVAVLVVDELRTQGLPPGLVSVVHGDGRAIGAALVTNAAIAAVGFTGSRAAGLALMRAAAGRAVPIPVHAEMSSINPVVVLESALDDAEALARAWVASLTMGVGQLCTNPGVVLLPRGACGDAFVAAAERAIADAEPGVMLSAAIAAAQGQRRAAMGADPGVIGHAVVRAGLLEVDGDDVAARPGLLEEVFGPFGVVVRLEQDAVEQMLDRLGGQLVVTVHAAAEDVRLPGIMTRAERLAGRVVFGGWPTGVAVCDAMVHGGPFPATSDGRTTSVGSLAIDRFVRPVAYQGMPMALLPPSLRD